MDRPPPDAALRAPSASTETGGHAHWPPPSDAPVSRRGLCNLAQPCLTRVQHTPRFLFQDASVVLVTAGRLDLGAGVQPLSVQTRRSLLLVDPGTHADLLKTPAAPGQPFRSVFLTLSPVLLEAFHRAHPAGTPDKLDDAPCRLVPLDEDLTLTLRHVVDSAEGRTVSDARLQCRLTDLLLAFAERGQGFKPARQNDTAARLRTLLGDTPDRHWTAHDAGRALAMSEATLRRRLAGQSARFEDLLIDVRMHHAMMLLQTTAWSIPRIAQACGYQSRARFAERFRARFGCLPSSVR